MSTPEQKLREATARIAQQRQAAKDAAKDQASGSDQTAVESSRAQQSTPTPQTPGGGRP